MSGRDMPKAGKSGVGEGATSPSASHLRRAHLNGARPQSKPKPIKAQARIRRLDSGVVQFLKGRPAQTLLELHRRGVAGATSGELSPLGWARRSSAYVFDLRAMGFEIETQYEEMGDALVGRYILRTALEVLPVGEGASC
jgi:hypothetical protein